MALTKWKWVQVIDGKAVQDFEEDEILVSRDRKVAVEIIYSRDAERKPVRAELVDASTIMRARVPVKVERDQT